MELLPAIDLRHGRVVRLRQGDAGRATIYGGDPLAVATAFAAAGVRLIHVVDLDAAFGEPPQRELVSRLAALLARAAAPSAGAAASAARAAAPTAGAAPAAGTAAPAAGAVAPAAGAAGPAAGATPGRVGLQLGGGLRDRAAVEWALAAGCERVVLGSLAASDPGAFGEIARAFPGRTVPALEMSADGPRVAGWTRAAGRGLDELCSGWRGLPCAAVLVTDVDRDGMLCGPNLELTCRVARATGLPALVSGGVRSLADLAAAAALPEIAGAILGRALYEHQVELAEALAACAAASATATPAAAASGTAVAAAAAGDARASTAGRHSEEPGGLTEAAS